MSRKAETILIAALLLFGLGIRLHFFIQSENLFSVEAEAYSKIQLMLQWDASPLPYPDLNFGPLHMILLWLPYLLGRC